LRKSWKLAADNTSVRTGGLLGELDVELRDRRQAGEVYTIRQVAEMTGVPENTIRSWERRFHVPQPERSGGNQRRYSERDVEVIRSIQAARDLGRTMDQAIQGVQRTEGHVPEVGPEPEVTFRESMAAPQERSVAEPAVDRLIDALGTFDGTGAEAIVSAQLWGTTVETVCVNVLLPAASAIQKQRAAGGPLAIQADFAETWIQMKLYSALDQSNPGTGRLVIMVAAMYDASAGDDALCLAVLLSRAGNSVMWLGAYTSVNDIAAAIELASPAAVVLAGQSDLSTVAVRAAVEHLEATRRDGTWQGLIAVAGSESSSGDDVVELPIHPTMSVPTIERGLQARDSALRLVRNR
ncbi:MAG: helix-turn-helix domain-containing protein, partial [Chloroflexota bacterium]|nr:helix-turn-helix domain-containing protein [Chloroflexota bacterium]